MHRGRFTETQIVSILKEAAAGGKVKDICRQHGISNSSILRVVILRLIRSCNHLGIDVGRVRSTNITR